MANHHFRLDQFIDFHTHQAREGEHLDTCEIVSSPKVLERRFTLERHPWATASLMSEFEADVFRTQLHAPTCLGLGEIGLDKLRGQPISEQMEILRQLLWIAQEEKKSVVLHCVKAFDELIALKKEFGGIENWAIHGFNKHPALARQLVDHGFYLSINPAEIVNINALLALIPLNKLFIETDDRMDLIKENYLCVAEALSMNLDPLKAQLVTNANVFFRHG